LFYLGRLFYSCPNEKESSCGFFEWKPKENLDHNRPHVQKVGCLYTNPPSYSYMVSDTGLTFQSRREDPDIAYAEYSGQLPILSLTNEMEGLENIPAITM